MIRVVFCLVWFPFFFIILNTCWLFQSGNSSLWLCPWFQNISGFLSLPPFISHMINVVFCFLCQFIYIYYSSIPGIDQILNNLGFMDQMASVVTTLLLKQERNHKHSTQTNGYDCFIKPLYRAGGAAQCLPHMWETVGLNPAQHFFF